MLIELSCTVEQYLDFLDRAEKEGIYPEFDSHGADEFSSFGASGRKPDIVIISGDETE